MSQYATLDKHEDAANVLETSNLHCEALLLTSCNVKDQLKFVALYFPNYIFFIKISGTFKL